jgi:lipid-binding SYLF domain-containing protein
MLLAATAVVYVSMGWVSSALANKAASLDVLESARATVEDLDGSAHRTEFRAAIRRADAVVIVPTFRPAGGQSGGAGGRPAVVVVHDEARGAWSDPAFYRLRTPGGNPPVPDGRMIFTVMTLDAVRQLQDGSATLGRSPDGLRATSITTGIAADIQISATADILVFVDVDKGMIGPSSFDGWRLEADPSLNRNFYTDGSTAKTILSRGAVRTPGVEKLIGGLRIARGIDTNGR